MRKVRGFYRRYVQPDAAACIGGHWQDTPFEDALFHCWGSEVAEFENGAATDTVAIVELQDGQVVTVMPNNLQFMDSAGGAEDKEAC